MAKDPHMERLKKKMDEMLKKSIDPDEPYCLDKPNLGHALVVNNIATEFPGSKEDVRALERVYKDMGFTVRVERDCSVTDMDELKQWMVSEVNHAGSNLFVLTTMSHGTEDGWLCYPKDTAGKCGKAWEIEKIVRELNEVKTLVGKPKLLLIYACRGGDVTPGQKTDTLSTQAELDIIADKADFYIAYGTVPGYVSIAPHPFGSFYLQSFAENLRRYYMTHSLDRIFTCTRHDMEDIKQNIKVKDKDGKVREVKDAKQCPEDRNSLRRVLMFSEFYKKLGLKEIERRNKREITVASQLKCKVEQTSIYTGFSGPDAPRMCLQGDDTTLVCGKENSDWLIKRFKQDGLDPKSDKLNRRPDGISQITIAGDNAVAVSYGAKQEIEFHGTKNLKKHSVAPHKPGVLHTLGASTLLYVDESEKPCTVRSLDFSTDKPTEGKIIVNSEHNDITDMCCVEHGSEHLLMVTDGEGRIFCYKLQDSGNPLSWGKGGMSVRGITTDGKGLLYACDQRDSCIQVCSVSKGKYLGSLEIEGEHLGKPQGITWCNKRSTLIVLHKKEVKHYFVTFIKVE